MLSKPASVQGVIAVISRLWDENGLAIQRKFRLSVFILAGVTVTVLVAGHKDPSKHRGGCVKDHGKIRNCRHKGS